MGVLLKRKLHLNKLTYFTWLSVLADGQGCDYDIGDRIGQIIIMPIPQVTFNVVDELSSSDRGVGGFGSSGS